MNDRPVALEAGTELEMPGPSDGNDQAIVDAVRSGQLNEAILDQAVTRLLTLIFNAAETLSQDYTCDMPAHHALARRVAGEGAVLLKNEGPVLPLAPDAQIALIGAFAKTPRYQGAGSSLMNPTRLDNLHDELQTLVGADRLTYAPGYTPKGDQPDAALIQEAAELAQAADVVVVCAGLTDPYETEGLDRTHMRMPPGHDALIEALAAVHQKVVVVLSNGSPVEMPWAGDVAAVLEGYLGGQAGAGGIADILVGAVNPSGKLAETFPHKLEHNPSFANFPGGPATVEYRESLYVGYRYYDAVDQDVLYPFGHGLSYTTFAYGDLQLSHTALAMPGSLTVTCTVVNTGDVAGQEIIQVYVRDVESTAFCPDKELKGFAKLHLEPGEEKPVSIELDERAFAHYDVALQDWRVEPGAFEILVGASSRDIRLSASVDVTSAQPAAPTVDRGADRGALAAYDAPSKGTPFGRQAFEALLRRPVPPNQKPRKGAYTLNTPVEDMGDSWIGRQLYKTMGAQMGKLIAGQEDTPMGLLMEAMSREMPLRGMLMGGDGRLTREMLEALLLLANGKFFRGVGALIRAIF
jgi:beta-glucosidase